LIINFTFDNVILILMHYFCWQIGKLLVCKLIYFMELRQKSLENLSNLLDRFLVEKGHPDSTIAIYNGWVTKLRLFMETRNFKMYDNLVGKEFLAFIKQGVAPKTYIHHVRFIYCLNCLLNDEPIETNRLRRRGKEPVFSGENGKYAEQFLVALEQELSLKPITIKLYKNALFHICEYLNVNDIRLQSLSKNVVQEIQASITKNQCNLLRTLKRFLHYLYREELICEDLGEVIQTVKENKQEKVFSVYTYEEVKRIEESIQRSSTIGKRNYAVILLASRLGMRASDICGLQFSNINWDLNKIQFSQYKTGKMLELPLLAEVGEALVDYIKNARPQSKEKNIFLTAVSPIRQLTAIAVTDIVVRQMTVANIDINGRKHGAHSLRHSLAARLLEKGTTLPVISETLGHMTTQATMHYLSIDIKGLLRCSLDIPPVSSKFYMQKGGVFYE
jgi:site-specific recombinase XerD